MTELEETTDELEIDKEELEEAKHNFERYLFLRKMTEMDMDEMNRSITKVMNRSISKVGRRNDCGIPPKCDKKDKGYNPQQYIFCSKYFVACSDKMERKMKQQ